MKDLILFLLGALIAVIVIKLLIILIGFEYIVIGILAFLLIRDLESL